MKSIFIHEPTDDDENEIQTIISEYSRQQPGYVERDFYTYKLYGDNDEFVGGVFFLLRSGWLSLYEFVIVESQRNKGYGKRMLKEVEEFAISKGCNMSQTSVYGYQNFKFYLKHGYEIKYTIEFKDERLNYYQLIKKLV